MLSNVNEPIEPPLWHTTLQIPISMELTNNFQLFSFVVVMAAWLLQSLQDVVTEEILHLGFYVQYDAMRGGGMANWLNNKNLQKNGSNFLSSILIIKHFWRVA